jgi:hypothetical protein
MDCLALESSECWIPSKRFHLTDRVEEDLRQLGYHDGAIFYEEHLRRLRQVIADSSRYRFILADIEKKIFMLQGEDLRQMHLARKLLFAWIDETVNRYDELIEKVPPVSDICYSALEATTALSLVQGFAFGILKELSDEQEQRESRLEDLDRKICSFGELGSSERVWNIVKALEVHKRFEEEDFRIRVARLRGHLLVTIKDLVAEGDGQC